MKAALFLLIIFLAACFRENTLDGDESIHRLSSSKQKQRIGSLQKKLAAAEEERKKIQTEVEKLNDQIHQAQLVLIRKQLDESEKEILERPRKYLGLLKEGVLFSQEREALHRMIQEGPSPWAFEAQTELDRILRMITELSEAHG